MSYSPEQDASKSDVDHGFGTVDALFVVAHEAAPARHPGERALDERHYNGAKRRLFWLGSAVPRGHRVTELGK